MFDAWYKFCYFVFCSIKLIEMQKKPIKSISKSIKQKEYWRIFIDVHYDNSCLTSWFSMNRSFLKKFEPNAKAIHKKILAFFATFPINAYLNFALRCVNLKVECKSYRIDFKMSCVHFLVKKNPNLFLICHQDQYHSFLRKNVFCEKIGLEL